MIKDILSAIKYKDINLYPICAATSDEQESNTIIFNAVKELQSKGVDARIHVAQGTAFGYIFCRGDEIDNIAVILSQDNRYCINNKPIDKLMKKLIVDNTKRGTNAK